MSEWVPSDQLIELVDALQVKGSLPDGDVRELESLLSADEKAREYYVLCQELNTMLEVDKEIRLKLASDLMPDNVIPLPGIDVSEVLPDPPIRINASSTGSKASGYRLVTSVVAMISGLAVLVWMYSQASELVEKTAKAAETPMIANSEGRVSFHREVLPILKENCFQCHGEDAEKRQGELRLDSAKAVLNRELPVIQPGAPESSELIARVTSLDPEYRMPPEESGGKLSKAQILTLTKWIEQGADYGSEWSGLEIEETGFWLAHLTGPGDMD